jgi:phospholipid/cholesterol/gamma-HCH transport system substrate-binding protein
MRLTAARAPLLVGLLVIGSIFGLLYMVSKVKTSVFTGPGSYAVHALFEDVTGLVEASTVTMVGTPVGVIESIKRVDTDEGMRARVTIRVAADVTLYAGEEDPSGRPKGAATVVRKQSSILGDFYLALSPGAFGQPLADGDYIPIVVGTSGVEAIFEQMEEMSRLYPRLESILANVEKISDGLAAALGGPEGKENLTEIVSNLKSISRETRDIAQQAQGVSEEIGRLVEEGTISRIADNVEGTSADAREIARKLEQIVSAGDVQTLVTNLSATSEKLAAVGTQLNELVEKGVTPRLSQLDRIFRNFERVSLTVADFADRNSGVLDQTLVNFRDVSEQAVALFQRSRGDVDEAMGTVKGTLLSAQLSLQKLDESLDNVRQITTDLREGKGSIGRLLTDDRLVEEIEEVISDTKGFVKSYTLMQTEVQLASSYHWYQESMKNVLSIKFKPKEDKYYLFQVIDDPRGYTTDRFVVTQTNDPDKPPVLKEQEETTTHSLKFSFQFAKRFYFLAGRFGIMENTGGIGLDFNFFQDRLQFQFDLFDFTMNTNPRLRSQVEWEVFRHFFVAGGADDLLNRSYRDYFLAAGIRFTDDDLKALLLAAPSINP